MKPEFMAEQLVDLHNDERFEKLASFAQAGLLTDDELKVDLGNLLEKQAYAEDATYADDLNRMFSIASPIETKISALYATKCASLLPEEVVNKLNDACKIYDIDIEIPVINKVASIADDPEIMAAIDAFEKDWVDPEDVHVDKYASADEYGTELDTCLAARACYVNEPEEVEALQNLAKVASMLPPEETVNLLHELDSELGLDTPFIQQKVGTPEYAVYEKVASDNIVHLGEVNAPLSVISEFQDEIKDLGVDLDWDGDSADALTLQLEQLPADIKSIIGSWVK